MRGRLSSQSGGLGAGEWRAMIGVNNRFVAAAALVVMVTAAADAQDYSFSVPNLDMHVVVNPDASASIASVSMPFW